jgi:glutamine amidotransferase
MIAIINTGGANLASIGNALDRLAAPFTITAEAAVIAAADRIILPGVGSARDAMPRIRQMELIDILLNYKRPVLGICLGMQLLYRFSQEGSIPCLGIIEGEVALMKAAPGVTIPHMGWNQIRRSGDASSPLLEGVAEGSAFYFVHSYRAPDTPEVIAYTEHGERIPAVVACRNFYGVQFHPERSGAAGAQILRNFINL